MKIKCFFIKISVMLAFLFLNVSTLHAEAIPNSIAFDVVLATQKNGRLTGAKYVIVKIGSLVDINKRSWTQSFSQVEFINGQASFVLGGDSNPIKPSDLAASDTVIQIEVDNLRASFPLPSVPYSIYAEQSKYVDVVDASKITGTFVTTLNIKNDLRIIDDTDTLFMVDYSDKKIGIGTTNPQYALDVKGIINASNFLIDGQDIESLFSWTKVEDGIFYNKGYVGVGLTNPAYSLDIQGTINANEYYYKNQPLLTYIQQSSSWKDSSDGNSIYFNDGSSLGNVGIGTSTNIVERLVVNGGIKLAKTIQSGFVVPGTIEFDNVDNDFYGYGLLSRKYSLTGLQLKEGVSPEKGNLLFWDDVKTVTSTKNLTFNEGKLAIGTTNASAIVTIQGDGQDSYFEIVDSSNNPIFKVDATGNIGIGKTQSTYELDVAGIVDASGYYINGQPLQTSFSSGSLWSRGRTNEDGVDLYYEQGNVGIGTQTPVNLLELSSSTDSAAITFDVNNNDLFTMGVNNSTENRFIISEGSNLDTPIFVFSSNSIGVGVTNPLATLHVSGNSGFLVEGALDPSLDWIKSGKGTRVFFFPGNSSFRAGTVSGTQWDSDRLGDYSTAFGEDNVASGKYSFVGGGYNNIASGNYAVIPGGKNNVASGDYSFAGGYYASALHDGSFVWADVTSTLNFKTTIPNQFLIRAYGGVGINTNDTLGAAMVVERKTSGKILNLKGTSGQSTSSFFTSDGKLALGTADPGSASLAVSGKIGLGTTEPKALLHIENSLNESGYSLYVSAPNIASSASENVLVITSTGNMGIGTTAPQGRLDVRGKIFAPAFIMVDPDDPSNTVQLQNNAGSPWSTKNDGKIIYYDKGYVGLGTATPNSLLELSNQNEIGSMPAISFDLDGNDFYKMGLVQDGSNVYFAIASSENFTTNRSPIVITNNSVIIGRGGATSNYSLDVSGNFFVQGKLAIATKNVHPVYDVLVDGSLAVITLNVNGQDFVPKTSPWITQGNNLYTLQKVGIGLTNPQHELHVNGTVSVNNLILSTNDFQLSGSLDATKLTLQDQSSATASGNLRVVSGQLIYVDPTGKIVILSSPLGVKQGDYSGPLAYWTSDTTVGMMPIFWDNDNNTLKVTSNLQVNNYKFTDKGLVVSSNVRFDNDYGMALSSSIDHKGNTGILEGYTLHDYDLTIETDWGKTAEVLEIKGLDLDMNSDGTNTLYNNSRAIGLYVDVTSVNINANENASKYAAIFLGGNVGIGKTDPQVALDVNGVISANYFNISDDLTVSKLIVGKKNVALSAEFDAAANSPRVGIGTLTPNVELDVIGTVSANVILVNNGISATSMNIGNNILVVGTSNIGIGTSIPSASFHIVKNLDSQLQQPYIAEKIEIDIDGVNQAGQTFTFNSDLTALQLELDTLGSTFMQNNVVKGIDVNFTSANINSTAKVYGLYVDVGTDAVSNKYAAVFNGGNVGIGITNPEVALHVSGNVKANNLVLDGSLEINRITINNLVVPKTASMNAVTINSLYVINELKAGSLSIADKLNVNDATFKNLTVNNIASINSLVVNRVSANIFQAKRGFYSKSLSIGTSLFQDNQLRVSGSIQANSLNLSQELIVPTLTVGTDGLFVGTDGKLGIGTTSPASFVHFVGNSTGGFNIENNETWNVMKLGLDTIKLNQTVGILFSPENTPSQSIGSAILASAANLSGKSDLIFITDPQNDFPQERMRINSEGNVGVGITNPSSMFHVNGTATIESSVTVNGVLSVSKIYDSSAGGIDVISTSDINFKKQASFSDKVIIQEAWGFKPVDSSTINFDSSFGYLYLKSSDNDLYFRDTTGKEVNITAAFTGQTGRIAYFNSSGSISDDAPFEFDSSKNQIRIGTPNSYTTFEVSSAFDAESLSELIAEEILITFNRRSGTSTTRFTGVNIEMNSSPGSPETAGRLGDGETAIGLAVDVSDLVHVSTSGTGKKIAGLFNGGLVGIGTTDPQAVLHVKDDATLDYNSVFQIDNLTASQEVQTLFVVTKNNVGIGISNPQAQLHVKNLDNTKDVLNVFTSSGSSALTVLDSGNIGVGITNPSVKFHVNGVVSANSIYSDIVSTNKLVVGNDFFVVDANNSGRIAIGTDNVNLATVSIFKQIEEQLNQDHISEKLDVVLKGINSGSFNGGNVYYKNKRNLTGFDVSLSSFSGNDIFGDTNNSVTAVGVSINMKDLNLFDNTSKAYGVYIETGSFSSSQKRYGAYFGGKVGIATKNPTAELAVSGTIKAKSLIVDSGTVLADKVTANSLFVQNDLRVSNSIRINELIANVISVNKLIAESEIQISTASFDVVTINKSLSLLSGAKVGIGITNPSLAFELKGNSKFNGDVDITNALSVASISDFGSDNIITINANLAISGIVSSNIFTTSVFSLVPTASTISQLTNQGQLFVSKNGTDLIYFEPGSTGNKVNLTGWLKSANAGRLPYFSDTSTYGLLDNMPLTWSNTNNSLTLGDSSSTTKFILNSKLSSEANLSSIAAQEINITFNRRVAGSSTRFKGLNITMESSPIFTGSNADTAGRLGDGETAIGISVDLTKLVNNTSVNSAQKIAALLNGGLVGVGTTLPKSLLHVVEDSNLNYENIFQVDNASNQTVFVVTQNKVGIGTSQPAAVLDITNINNNDNILRLVDTGSTRFIVNKDGKVGIGLTNPQFNLDVVGTITANIVSAPTVSTNKLIIGTNFLTIDGTTNQNSLMIGTTNTSLGSIAVVNNVTSQQSSKLLGQTVDFIINNNATSSQPYYHDHDITAMALNIKSNSVNDSLGNSRTAVGVSINMNELNISKGSAYGIYVDAGDSSLGGNRYAAYFKGNVGIATLNPTVALEVGGTVKAEGLIVNGGSISAEKVTVNKLLAKQDLGVSGNVTVEKLVANIISVNKVIVLDTVQISTGSFNIVTINNLLSVADGAKLGVGVNSTSKVFEVSGDSFLNGEVDVDGILKVKTISSSESFITVNKSLHISGTASANKLVTRIQQFNAVSDSDVGPSNDFAQLYSTGNDLIFAKKSATLATVNITGSLTGTAGFIPHYDTSDGFGLKFDMPLSFDSASDTLKLGSSTKQLTLKVDNTIAGDVAHNIKGQEIKLLFQNRNQGLTNVFSGLTIDFDSENYGSQISSQVGRLGPDEVAIGLNVDMSSFLGSYFQSNGSLVTARKYSGVFQGGLVGIGVSRPQATLHVASEQISNWFPENNDVFRVDVDQIPNAFKINANGFVGINDSDPKSRLSIKQQLGQDGLFVAKNSSNEIEFAVSANAVGIGVAPQAGALLTVLGDVAIKKTDGTDIVNIKSGKLGIGNTNPTSLLDIKGTGTEDLFKLSKNSEPIMFVDSTGKTTFGSSTSGPFKLNIKNSSSGAIVFSGPDAVDPLANTNIPSDITGSTYKPYGFLAVNDTNYVFLGNVTKNRSILSFGGQNNSNSTLEITHTNKQSGILVTTNVVTISDIALSIGGVTDNVDTALYVSGNFLVNNNILFVDTANVGIGTKNTRSDIALAVEGLMMADSLEVTDSGIKISTLDVRGQVELTDTIGASNVSALANEHYSSLVSINLGVDTSKSLYGLKVKMESNIAPDTDEDPKFLVAGNADAYGIHVDISELFVADASTGTYGEVNYGNKYAALFNGGAVGIGTLVPKYPLHVKAQENGPIAAFGSNSSDLVIRDFGSGTIGLNVIDQNRTSFESLGIVMKPGNSVASQFSPGFVGIGTSNPDKSLVVNGDMRLGIKSNNQVAGAYGNYGSKLFFSGGPNLNGQDSDNGDALFMARYNESAYNSRLRLNFSTIDEDATDESGVGQGYDQFVVGYTKSQTYIPVFKVHNNSTVTIWGDSTQPVAALSSIPQSVLHVRANTSNEDGNPLSNYVTALENTASEEQSSVLALIFSSTNSTKQMLNEDSRYISFMTSSAEVGAIEGNNSGGIRYKTRGADYAEYLEKENKNEQFEIGDVVAVYNGKITKDFSKYQQLMVLSSSAAVAGNWPKDNKEDYELVAFFGQVQTKVRGAVKKGDFILPDTKNSGVGIAKSEKNLTMQDRSKIIGRAWESSNEKSIKLINVAVGFSFGSYTLKDEMSQINELTESLATIKSEREALLKSYQEKLDRKEKIIDELLLRLEQTR